MPAAKLAATAPGPPSALPDAGMLATRLLPAFEGPIGFTCIPHFAGRVYTDEVETLLGTTSNSCFRRLSGEHRPGEACARHLPSVHLAQEHMPLPREPGCVELTSYERGVGSDALLSKSCKPMNMQHQAVPNLAPEVS